MATNFTVAVSVLRCFYGVKPLTTTIDNTEILNRFEQYLSVIALSSKTITNYLADLRIFVRWGEEKYGSEFSLRNVSADQIRAYREYMLAQNRAPSTVNRYLQALRKCCAYLAHTNLTASNAAEEIPLVKISSGKTGIRTLTDEQVAGLIRAAKNTRPSIAKRDVAIIYLLVYGGLRVAEIVDLVTDDVVFDFPGVHLLVRDSRGFEAREVPLETEVCKSLKEWLTIRPKSAPYNNVFLSQEGRPISGRTVQRIVHRSATEVGMTRITPQTLRRTFAHNLYQTSNDLELVRRRLGHQTLGVTQQYLKLK